MSMRAGSNLNWLAHISGNPGSPLAPVVPLPQSVLVLLVTFLNFGIPILENIKDIRLEN